MLGAILCAGVFRDFGHLGGKDWEGVFGQAQAELTTLRDYGQWPLWNPWRSGGQPSLAQPVSMLLSPVTPFVFLFGVVAGFKLALLPLFVLGCLGTWALSGHLGLRRTARLVPGIVLFGSSIFPLYVCGGLPNWLCAMALLPWLFLAHRRSCEHPRFLVGVAAAYAGLLFCGAVDRFLFIPVFLGLDALFLALRQRSTRPLRALGAALFIGLGLGALKILPVLEVYLNHPREMEAATRFVAPRLLPRLFLGTDLPELVSLRGSFVDSVYWINAGSYVGPLALLLAGLGAWVHRRATWSLLLLTLTVTWLSFGAGVTPSLWTLLHRLPGLASLRGPERLVLFVTFLLALLAGFGWRALSEMWRIRGPTGDLRSRIAGGVLLAALVAPLLYVNAPISQAAFVVEPTHAVRGGGWFTQPAPRPTFRQARFPGHPLQWVAPLYEPVLLNRGSVTSLPNIPIERAARPEGVPGYRGEAFVSRGQGRVDAELTPNVIRIRAHLRKRGRLVINQNFNAGWHVAGAPSLEVLPLQGLLSLDLPAGEHDIELRFLPTSVLVGSAITLATLVFCAFLWRRPKRST